MNPFFPHLFALIVDLGCTVKKLQSVFLHIYLIVFLLNLHCEYLLVAGLKGVGVNQTQVRLLDAQKRQASIERKVAVIRKAGNLGRRCIHVSRATPKILLSHDNF